MTWVGGCETTTFIIASLHITLLGWSDHREVGLEDHVARMAEVGDFLRSFGQKT
jgi:hypothetical protein